MMGWRSGETVNGAERQERARILRNLCAPVIAETGKRRRDGRKQVFTLQPVGTALELVLTSSPTRQEYTLAVYAAGNQVFFMEWCDERRHMKVPCFIIGGWELGAIEIGRKWAETSRRREVD
jgi:hypothetical protein